MRILLIDPPNTRRLIPFSNRNTPNGLGYISAYLQEHIPDLAVQIVQLSNPFISLDKFLRETGINNFKYIGVTVYHWNRQAVRYLLKRIKEMDSSVVTIIGGPEASLDPNILNVIDYADFCIIGEGELTLLELIQHLELESGSANLIKKIPGIVFRDPITHEIYRTPYRKLISDLDSVPSPYLNNIFNLTNYDSASITTARGCPHKCIFCACGALFGHTIRYHSIHRVLSEIDYVVNSGIKRIIIADDTFTFHIQRTKEILNEIIKKKYDNLHISCETRVDRVDKDLLQRMKKAGIKSIYFGLESGSERVLKLIRKGIKLNEFHNAIGLAKKEGLRVIVSFILGLPGETFQEALKTIEIAEKVKADEYALNLFIPVLGTEAWNRKEELRIILDDDFTIWEPFSHTDKLSIEDLETLREIALNRLPTINQAVEDKIEAMILDSFFC